MESKSNDEGLKFISAEIENFKSIEKRIIDIGGRSLLVTGANGAGKSSFLQALMSPLDSKIIPTQPIKKGEERGRVQIVIAGHLKGEYHKYTMDVFFTPANKRGRIVLYNEKGEEQKAPATLIKSLIGNISFNIFDFLNAEKDKKIKTLKELTGRKDEIEVVEEEIDLKKKDKSSLEAVIKNDEVLMKNHGFSQEEIELYSEPIDIKPLQESLENISSDIDKYNATKKALDDIKKIKDDTLEKITGIIEKREDLNKIIEAKRNQIKALEEEILVAETAIKEGEESEASLNESLPAIDQRIKKGDEWLSKTSAPNATEISQKITDATVHNEKHNKINEYASKQKSIIANKQKLQKFDGDLESLTKKKMDIISSSQLPVEGLYFTDNEIFVNGLPMEEGQINTAELIKIGMKITIAMKPNLRVVFVPEGSMFDKHSLIEIIKEAESHGFMVIAEYVDPDGGELSIKFTEEEF